MERRTAIAELSRDEIAELVARVLPDAEVVACALESGGRANTNYRVDLADRRVLLRVCVRDPASCAKEVALGEALADLPVARPLGHGASDAGPYAVLEHLPGTMLADLAPEMGGDDWLAAGRQLGGFLAQLTRMTFERPGDLTAPPLEVRPWPWADGDALGFLRWCLFESPAGERLGASLRHEVWAHAVEASQRWAPAPTAHLAHGDFGPTNLLFDDGRLSGVVDWEFAHAGDLHMDLGNVLRPRPGYAPGPELGQGIEEGLRAEGVDLPADWRERAAFTDLAALLEFLSSAEDRPLTHEAARERITATVRGVGSHSD